MFDAKKAKENAILANQKKYKESIDKVLPRILKAIEKASLNGEFGIDVYIENVDPHKYCIKELEKLGFRLIRSSCTYRIYWS